MSLFTSRPALRWLVPAGVTAVVLGGGAAAGTLTAAADPSLPPRSAAQLLVDLQTARLDGMSGTVVETADLGIPALPGAGGQGSSELTSLVSGSHTLRVWYAGPDSVRLALIGTLGESDVVRVGSDVWTWDSRANAATHRTLPAQRSTAAPHGPDLADLPKTPQEAADAALKAIDPSTVVTTTTSGARVAGRSAYELALAPRDTDSLVGQVRVAIDTEQHVPLRVEVYAKGASRPAFSTAFTAISFSRPDAAQFRFTPPAGASVTEAPAPTGSDPAPTPDAADRPHFAVVGTGWTSVLVAKAPATPDGARPPAATPQDARSRRSEAGDAGGFPLQNLPTVSGAWGSGHLLTGSLFSVLLTDDGRILAGAVSPERLYGAAADPAAALK
jgi:outer membrane lipoprotein-sorting protein